jgi:hypothetical protein
VARFLVDESLPRRVTTALTEAGHAAVDAHDCGLRGAPDDAVYARAVRTDGSWSRATPTSPVPFVSLREPIRELLSCAFRRVVTRGPRTQIVGALDEALLAMAARAIVIVEPGRVRVLGSQLRG